MNTHTSDMTTHPLDLTVELHSADGTVAEFYQTDAERIRTILRRLATPRLFTQPELILTSKRLASAITTRAIDVILARTAAPLPRILPLNSPAGPVDISEVEGVCDGSAPTVRQGECRCPDGIITHTFRVGIHTLGGWASVLEVRAQVRGTVEDRCLTFAHVFHVPVIPFNLPAGGIGFINPANLTRATAYPPPDSLPENALPLELLRWTPSRSQGGSSLAKAMRL